MVRDGGAGDREYTDRYASVITQVRMGLMQVRFYDESENLIDFCTQYTVNPELAFFHGAEVGFQTAECRIPLDTTFFVLRTVVPYAVPVAPCTAPPEDRAVGTGPDSFAEVYVSDPEVRYVHVTGARVSDSSVETSYDCRYEFH